MPANPRQILKFLVSGTLAAGLLLVVLYVLHGILGFWYLGSSAIAFLCAVAVNYSLQKRWTFNAEMAKSRRKAVLFFVLNLVTIGINTGLMLVLVERLGLQYLWAQAGVQVLLACGNFVAYRAVFGLSSSDEG